MTETVDFEIAMDPRTRRRDPGRPRRAVPARGPDPRQDVARRTRRSSRSGTSAISSRTGSRERATPELQRQGRDLIDQISDDRGAALSGQEPEQPGSAQLPHPAQQPARLASPQRGDRRRQAHRLGLRGARRALGRAREALEPPRGAPDEQLERRQRAPAYAGFGAGGASSGALMPELSIDTVTLGPHLVRRLPASRRRVTKGAHALVAKLGGDDDRGGQVTLQPHPPHPARALRDGGRAPSLVRAERMDDGLGERSLQSGLGVPSPAPCRADGARRARANFTLMLIAAVGIRAGLAVGIFQAPELGELHEHHGGRRPGRHRRRSRLPSSACCSC